MSLGEFVLHVSASRDWLDKTVAYRDAELTGQRLPSWPGVEPDRHLPEGITSDWQLTEVAPLGEPVLNLLSLAQRTAAVTAPNGVEVTVEILGSREPGCGSCRWFVRLVVPGGTGLVVASDPTRLLAASQESLRGMDAALAFLADAVEHANVLLRQLDAVIEPEVLGRLDHHERNLIEGQGETTDCGSGRPLTDYEGRWLHVYNPELTGCDDHVAQS